MDPSAQIVKLFPGIFVGGADGAPLEPLLGDTEVVLQSTSQVTGNIQPEDFRGGRNEITNHGRGAYFFGASGVDILDNTITGTTNYAIGIFDGDPANPNSDFEIAGNILTGNNRGIWVDPASGPA